MQYYTECNCSHHLKLHCEHLSCDVHFADSLWIIVSVVMSGNHTTSPVWGEEGLVFLMRSYWWIKTLIDSEVTLLRLWMRGRLALKWHLSLRHLINTRASVFIVFLRGRVCVRHRFSRLNDEHCGFSWLKWGFLPDKLFIVREPQVEKLLCESWSHLLCAVI